jgi:predicted nuclease of predicted toxin-antitoxin system
VSTVLGQGLGGKSDPEVAAACKTESKVLITLDTDFANLSTYPPEDYSGIIVLRLANQAKPHVLSILARLLDSLGRQSPLGRLWIVDEYRIRIRPGGE